MEGEWCSGRTLAIIESTDRYPRKKHFDGSWRVCVESSKIETYHMQLRLAQHTHDRLYSLETCPIMDLLSTTSTFRIRMRCLVCFIEGVNLDDGSPCGKQWLLNNVFSLNSPNAIGKST